MKILVTGGNGFLGRNLISQLNNEGFTDITNFTIEHTLEDLDEFTKSCQFVFHLAGVNRPKDDSEFFSGNRDLTQSLLTFLEKNQNAVPVLISSSIQSERDNPYGDSKKQSEDLVFDYGKRNSVEVMVYRLKNLFGKWSRPNYNSVVATFCYNLSRDIPVQVNNPETPLTLTYVDDVVKEFVKALKSGPTKEDKYCVVDAEEEISLGGLVEKLTAFRDNRKTLIMPSLKKKFDRNLYGTYLSYLEEDNFSYNLTTHKDDRGWLAEFIKSEDNGQIFISTTKPGITRGNHWHHTKVEKFLVIQGEGLIRFRNIFSEDIIEYPVSGDSLSVVDIPPGYTHAITNVGKTEMLTLFWACEIFDQDNPDTYFVEV